MPAAKTPLELVDRVVRVKPPIELPHDGGVGARSGFATVVLIDIRFGQP